MTSYDTLAIMNAIQTIEPIVAICTKANSAVDLNFSIEEFLLMAVLYEHAENFINEYQRLYNFNSQAIEE